MAALGGTKSLAADAPATGREYYELRAYRLKAGAGHAVLDAYLEKGLIPELNSSGVPAVGVFTEPEAKDGDAVWVLIPRKTLDGFAGVVVGGDRDAATKAYFAASTKERPAFERVDTWLLRAFTGFPQAAVPALKRDGKDRIFELRTYHSFNEEKARLKVEMFHGGEIGLMQQLGMSPVFYGEGLAGSDLPHLTYMLCNSDKDTHAKAWKAFFDDPVWLKLKNDPRYADTVNRVESRFLVPAAFSQI
ncbi:MAG TPA: NIPSNAP family protein [Opitutus sp.]|nr:NIPSNAP family protein [Opitutus sp.]